MPRNLKMVTQDKTTKKVSIRKNPRHARFKGIWIPSELYSIFELSPLDRELLSFINGFGPSGCRASNAYMADLFNVGTPTVKRSITKLKRLRLIINIGPNRLYLKCSQLKFPVCSRVRSFVTTAYNPILLCEVALPAFVAEATSAE